MSEDIILEVFKESEYTVRIVKKEFGKTLDYSVNSLKDLDSLIEYVKKRFTTLKKEGKLTDQTIQGASVSIGCYLGEVIRKAYGGNWVEKDTSFRVLAIDDREISPSLYIYERLNKDSDYNLDKYWSDTEQYFSNPIAELGGGMAAPEASQMNLVEGSSERVPLLNPLVVEQRKRTGDLINISTAAILLIILTVIGFVLGFCSMPY